MTARPTRLAGVLASFAVALALVGLSSGSGWVMVIVAGLGGLLLVGTAGPALVVATAKLEASLPTDAVAGRGVALGLAVRTRGPVVVRPLAPAGAPVAAHRSARGEVVVVPDRRGLVAAVDLDVESAAPLGLVRWRRRHRLRPDRVLHVAPRPLAHPLPPPRGVGGGAGRMAPSPAGESVRTLREHTPGDALRLVHWPASARRGTLLVKELEDPEARALAVVVDLRGRADAAEEAASRAAGLVAEALAAGVPVTLLTAEAGGPRVAPVASMLEAGRRLARAVDRPPPAGPVPAGTTVVVVAPDAAEAATP